MRSILNKHAIITGGNRGIGLAIAQTLALKGASCTLIARNQVSLESAKASLPPPNDASIPLSSTTSRDKQEARAQHATWAMDVSDHASWKAMLSSRTNRSPVDILVNAAGIAQYESLVRTDPDGARGVVMTNLMGTTYGCQIVMKEMMRQKSGVIVNVSSLLATHGGQGASVYAASKAGIVALTRSLAWEAGRFGIRCNVILPGYIQTDMTKSLKNDLSKIPLGRLGETEEVADAALFLIQNPYAHNTVLNLDGGLSAS